MSFSPTLRYALGALLVILGGCLGVTSPINPTALGRDDRRQSPATTAMTESWSSVGPVFARGSAGKLNAFAYVRSDPRIMFVAGGWGNTPRESPSQAGIFRTTDGGLHWVAADDGLTNRDGTISSVVNGLWLDQARPAVVLAATEFGGTFRSTDGGKTWNTVDRSESTQFAQVGTELYLASRRGVLESADDGLSWNVSLASASGATTVVTAAGATFAGDASGNVFRLRGDTWSLAGHPGTGAIHDIAIDPFHTRVVYANVDDQKAWNQVLWGSVDAGKSWTRIFCHCSVGEQAVAFSLVVPDRLYLGDDGGNGSILYFSADGDAHPRISSGGRTRGADVRYIFPVATGSRTETCYFVSDQGLFHDGSCTSGPTVGLSNGIANFLAYDATLSSDTKSLVVPLQDYGAVSGATGGTVRFIRHSSEGGETFLNPYDPRRCYLAHPDDGLFISAGGCASFSGPYSKGIESLAFEPPRGSTMYAIARDDIDTAHPAVSTNGGSSWRPMFDRQLQHPYQIVASPANSKMLLVAGGTPDGPNYASVSRDGGVTWRESTGLPQTVELVEQYFPAHRFYAAFDPQAPKTVLLADHDPATNNVLIFRSRDAGRAFRLVSTLVQPPTQRPWPSLHISLEDERRASDSRYYAARFYANRLAFDPRSAPGCVPAVVLTTRFGAFESFDTGTSWRRIDTAAIPHHFIGVTWVNGSLYLASFGGGVIESAVKRGC